ncbi:MAG: SDR family NAD(P)-dependent oxidoreductase [Fidelibacterota bacterium]|nr:MAG: SDR family NAD(P)-dependent oxidoreductase [Candidatus Neomarinimicrobiota bacterium]
MKILITGGAGFIGSHVADRFVELGHEVVILDDLSTGLQENVRADVKFIKGDITDSKLVKELFEAHKFSAVSHHAAQMNVRLSVENPTFDAQTNILGTINLLQAAARNGVKKFMFSSTGGAVYGEQEAFPADESHPTNPLSPYGISKLACEKYISYYSYVYDMQMVIMRYANVYGPRQNPYGEAGVVAIFSNHLVRGEPVTINGDGLQTRDYIYIEDVVDLNEISLGYPGSIIVNVGTGIETDVVTIYRYLAEASCTELEARHGPAKPGEQRRSVISPQHARIMMGWKAQTALSDGLTMTYHSFEPESRSS